MGGAGRLWSSWNHGFQAGNLQAEPGPGQGGKLGLGAQIARSSKLGRGNVDLA